MTLFDRAMITGGLLVVFTVGLLGAAHARGKKKKGGPPMPAASGGAQRVKLDGVREPSGIVLHPPLRHLFVVGDEGTLAELDADGKTIRADTVAGNLEDVTFHPPSAALVLLVENEASLVVYDPVAHKEKRRIALDTTALLGREPDSKKGQGFEGLAFRPEPGRPGGGVFYLAHQRSPAMMVGIAFDPDGVATIGKDAVVVRWPMERYQHLTAISYEPSLGRFLLIADGRLVVLRADGTTEAESALPAVQPEGVCLDASGALWIADDPAGLLRFPGGVASLKGKGVAS